MKLFQRLLVAPAALGLMVPMAANASEQINDFTSRVDSIENSVEAYEAGVFSNQQTKLSGSTVFNIGGVDGGSGEKKSTHDESIVFNYDTIINLDSSFSGSDLLRTTLRASNFQATDPFGNELALQERGFTGSGDTVVINRAFYQFPIGEDFTATFGAMVRQDDILGVWPSDYPSDSILDVLTYAGANRAYPLTLGTGFGLSYLSDSGRWSATALAISSEGHDVNEGIWKENADDVVTAQIAYIGDRWRIALANTSADAGEDWGFESNDQYNAWGFSGVYQIDAGRRPTDDITLIPSSISGGLGWSSPIDSDEGKDIENSRTYSLGIVWTDAFSEGNDFGIAYGTAEDHITDGGYDDPMAWEIYYAMGINDNITVTPAFFQVQKDNEDDLNGVVVKTTFAF